MYNTWLIKNGNVSAGIALNDYYQLSPVGGLLSDWKSIHNKQRQLHEENTLAR